MSANTPPAHLFVPDKLPNVVVVRLTGSISRIVVELYGMPYILPLGAKTPPIHFYVPDKLPNVVVVRLTGSISRTVVELNGMP